ncbi:MAG: TonB-dependent receptor domain-containing protein [Mangrovibacterium sp.]
MLKQVLLLALLLLGGFAQSYSYADSNPTADSAVKTKSTIKGVVYERDSNAPMPYVNVAVYNSADDALINGNITNEIGVFNIENVPVGNYYVKINFIGFQEFKVNNIVVNGDKNIDLGKLSLATENTELEGVEVVADRQRVQYKVDKKVVNVAQDINAAGGTAVDVLENTPSVQVDIEGNVSVRGSSNFTVLIDGRPTALDASDALQQIPASALENIEIITNPSAKYDPDGMGGILNLVTKKDALNGFDGIFNVMGATNGSYRGDFTLNHRNSKRLLTFGLDYNNRAFIGNGDMYRETYDSDGGTNIQDTEGERSHSRGGYSMKLGSDFYLSDKTTLGFNAKLGRFQMKQNGGGDNYYAFKDAAGNLLDQYNTFEDEIGDRTSNYGALTASLTHNFNDENTHKLEASLFYRYRDGDDASTQLEQYYDNNHNLTNDYVLNMTSVESETSQDVRAKVDYTRPLGLNGKLEAGYQARIRIEDETYGYTGYNSDGDLDLSNYMDFNRQIHSLYGTYSNSWGGLSYMAGLRAEYTNRVIADANDNESVVDRLDWFPSAHLSYDLGEKTQVMGSYSKRIDRPRGWDLNPFESYMNQTTIRKGNPDLTPEYTNSFDIGLMQKFGTSFLSVEAFYRSTQDKIDHISSLREDGVMVQQVVNSGDDKSLGGEVMANVDVLKWLTLNGSVSVYQYMLSTQVDGVYVDKSSTNLDGQLNATFKFSKSSRMQIMASYRGPSVSAQGDREGTVFTNLSYKQDLFKNKLSATLSIQDIFGTGGWRGTSSGEGFYQEFDFSPQPRVVQLTLSYKLNNYKEKKEHLGENEMDFGGSSQSY